MYVACIRIEPLHLVTCLQKVGRKRDLKNVHAKRPPQLNPEDPETLNEWGEELARMTDRRRQHNERHKPGRSK